jgi:hypothetical protein
MMVMSVVIIMMFAPRVLVSYDDSSLTTSRVQVHPNTLANSRSE